jgi:hypothetical protein
MALAVCRAGLGFVPNDPELLTQEGMLLRSAGDLLGAEACFSRLIGPEAAALPPDQACWVRHNLGQLYRQTGRGVQAAAQWRARSRSSRHLPWAGSSWVNSTSA